MVLGFIWGTERSPIPLTQSLAGTGENLRETDEMDQLGNDAGTAGQNASLAHEHAVALGLEPVPTMILVAALVLVGLVAVVVRGGTRRPRGAHRA